MARQGFIAPSECCEAYGICNQHTITAEDCQFRREANLSLPPTCCDTYNVCQTTTDPPLPPVPPDVGGPVGIISAEDCRFRYLRKLGAPPTDPTGVTPPLPPPDTGTGTGTVTAEECEYRRTHGLGVPQECALAYVRHRQPNPHVGECHRSILNNQTPGPSCTEAQSRRPLYVHYPSRHHYRQPLPYY